MDAEFEGLLRPFLRYAGEQPLQAETRLRDLGLDSMQEIQLLFTLEDAYGVTVPDDKLVDTSFETCGALWSMIDSLRTADRTPT